MKKAQNVKSFKSLVKRSVQYDADKVNSFSLKGKLSSIETKQEWSRKEMPLKNITKEET